MTDINRRRILKAGLGTVAASALPMTMVEVAYGAARDQRFTFAYISDSHITHVRGSNFVRNWDQGLIKAVAECNLLQPAPDFCIYGGDLGQLGKKEELDRGLEIMSALRYKTYYVLGEHDYYLDMGRYWERVTGNDPWYSFNHKGVHFVVLNSILTWPDWMADGKWSDPMDRMLQMARLDNPNGSPFMVGEEQRAWLARDLSRVRRDTPLVVVSHSPLQKIYKGWNFWTEDAEQVQELLKPFDNVTVLYGHVHQIQYNQVGNIAFSSVMATAWPWPYPESYAQVQTYLPKLTVHMNRADPFHERDATGWQFLNMETGRVDLHYQLDNNVNRTVAFNDVRKQPEDTVYQDEAARTAAQRHY